jgi:hypothetical protein
LARGALFLHAGADKPSRESTRHAFGVGQSTEFNALRFRAKGASGFSASLTQGEEACR